MVIESVLGHVGFNHDAILVNGYAGIVTFIIADIGQIPIDSLVGCIKHSDAVNNGTIAAAHRDDDPFRAKRDRGIAISAVRIGNRLTPPVNSLYPSKARSGC